DTAYGLPCEGDLTAIAPSRLKVNRSFCRAEGIDRFFGLDRAKQSGGRFHICAIVFFPRFAVAGGAAGKTETLKCVQGAGSERNGAVVCAEFRPGPRTRYGE